MWFSTWPCLDAGFFGFDLGGDCGLVLALGICNRSIVLHLRCGRIVGSYIVAGKLHLELVLLRKLRNARLEERLYGRGALRVRAGIEIVEILIELRASGIIGDRALVSRGSFGVVAQMMRVEICEVGVSDRVGRPIGRCIFPHGLRSCVVPRLLVQDAQCDPCAEIGLVLFQGFLHISKLRCKRGAHAGRD